MNLSQIRAQQYTWDRGKPSARVGIALHAGGRIFAHLSFEEAQRLAEHIQKLCEKAEPRTLRRPVGIEAQHEHEHLGGAPAGDEGTR